MPTVTGADVALARESAYNFGGDWGSAAEGATVTPQGGTTPHSADLAHALEAGSVRYAPVSADAGHGAEAGSVHASLAKGDTVHGLEASGISGSSTPHSADTAKATESAFYYHGDGDAAHGAEGYQVAVAGVDRSSAADVPRNAWPSSRDAAKAADAPLRSWPRSADAGLATEAVKPFPAASADSGHGGDAVHEIGIWTYVATGVRLLLPPPYRHDPVAAARLETAAARLAALPGWVRVTRRVRSADASRTSHEGQIAGRWGD